jgi:hypothetical protein
MTDYVGYILQGLFTGIGVGVAGYITEKHIRTKLEKIEFELRNIGKNANRNGGK